MIARGIADPVAYAKKMIAELNDSKEKNASQIGETSVSKNVGYFLLKVMIDSLSIDSDLAMMTTDGIYGHFTVCYLAMTVLRLLEIKVFNEKLTPAEIIVFIRDYNVIESTNGAYINNATAGSVYRKIKEVLGLSKLGNLYLTKKNIDNFFKNVDLNTSN